MCCDVSSSLCVHIEILAITQEAKKARLLRPLHPQGAFPPCPKYPRLKDKENENPETPVDTGKRNLNRCLFSLANGTRVRQIQYSHYRSRIMLRNPCRPSHASTSHMSPDLYTRVLQETKQGTRMSFFANNN